MPTKKSMQQFGNLAMMYYPGKAYSTALRLFRQEIALTRGLLGALKNTGYNERQRRLSPRQVKVIEKFLGEP